MLLEKIGIKIGTNYVEGKRTLLVGPPSSGKGTFCLTLANYLLNKGRKVIYGSTERLPDETIKFVKEQFNWNFKKYEDKGLLTFVDLVSSSNKNPNKTYIKKRFITNISNLTKFSMDLGRDIKKFPNAYLILDSLSAFSTYSNALLLTKFCIEWFKRFNEAKVSSLTVLEKGSDDKLETGLRTILDCIFETKIVEGKKRPVRYFRVFSCKGQNYSEKWFPTKITKKGLEISS